MTTVAMLVAADADVSTDARLTDVARIRQRGQQQKEGTENVFPLGDPGDRLNVKWVHPEYASHERAAPRVVRQAAKQLEHEQRVDDVENEVGDVVRTGVCTKERDVEQVRQPRHRMPVRGVPGRQRPPRGPPIQTLQHRRVFRDIGRIIPIDELEVAYG